MSKKNGKIIVTYKKGKYRVEFDNPELEEQARTVSQTLAHLDPRAVAEYEKGDAAMTREDWIGFQYHTEKMAKIIEKTSKEALVCENVSTVGRCWFYVRCGEFRRSRPGESSFLSRS